MTVPAPTTHDVGAPGSWHVERARRAVDRFDDLLGEPVSPRSLAAVRILVGLVAIAHLRPLASAALAGDTHHGHFVHPYVDAFARVPPGPYTAIMVAGVAAAVAMTIGLATRVTTALTFGVVAFHLLISTTHVHNNRLYLVTILLVLAMSPCGRAGSLDAAIGRLRGDGPTAAPTVPAWPIWLLRFACATVYAASGLSKLLDPDWFGGLVTWGRVTLGEADLRASLLPDPIVDVLLDRGFHTVAAKAIVLTELGIAAGFWSRRTRLAAVGAAIVFHVMIELSANVQLFSWLGIAVLVVWFDPDLGGIGRRRWAGVEAPATP